MAAPGPPPSVLLEGNAAAIVFGAVSFLQRPLLRWERQRMFSFGATVASSKKTQIGWEIRGGRREKPMDREALRSLTSKPAGMAVQHQ